MKAATMQLIVDAIDGPHHELAKALLHAEFHGAIEPQLPLQPVKAPMTNAERQAKYRNERNGGSNGRVTKSNVTTVTENVTPSLPSLSLSLENSAESERESPSGDARERNGVTEPVTVVRNGALRNERNGERYVRIDERLTDELVAIAQQCTVQDIDGTWAKFTGYYADKWVHVNGTWKHWCAKEAKYERVERERQRERAQNSANPLTADGLDPSSYEASVARKKRRKAEEEQERAELRARLEAQKASAQ